MDYSANSQRGKELLKASNLPTEEPIVALTGNASNAKLFASTVNLIKKHSPYPTIDKVWTYSSLLPNHQQEKITLINEIKSKLNPEKLSYMQGIDSRNAN